MTQQIQGQQSCPAPIASSTHWKMLMDVAHSQTAQPMSVTHVRPVVKSQSSVEGGKPTASAVTNSPEEVIIKDLYAMLHLRFSSGIEIEEMSWAKRSLNLG